METNKKWYKSKTLWLAILQGVAGILVAIINVNPNMKIVGGAMVVKSVIDFGLRLLTSQPIQ